jgi:single-stranded DNA-binding protein
MEFQRVIHPIRRMVGMVATVDRDPEVKHLPDGQAVANFSVAQPPGRLVFANISGPISSVNVNERVYEVTVRGKLAEICGKCLAEGQKIEISGRLETRRDADGKRDRVIFAEAIYFAGAPPEAAIRESVADHDDNITRWLNYEELPEGVRALNRPIGRSR